MKYNFFKLSGASLFLFTQFAHANLPWDFVFRSNKSKLSFESTSSSKDFSNIHQEQKYAYCKRKVLVAVIDTGIDIQHPDLKSSIWMNDGESGLDSHGRDKATNGIDDDHNGYVDDVHGWNFADRSNKVQDLHGHGTHIAGIIAGFGTPGGVRLPQCVTIMPIKYIDPDTNAGNSILNTTMSILYAIKMGAEIINYSGGGLNPNDIERRSVQLANNNHILFIAASGNEANDADIKPFFPANYQTPNMISVGAVDREGKLLDNSNYGEKSVDVAALGLSVFSTLPQEKYGLMSGTSQATAFVTRAAASLLSSKTLHFGQPDQWKSLVLAQAKKVPGLKGKIKTSGVISVATAQSELQIRRLDQSSFARKL